MRNRLSLDILAQPDDTTCGPTCLHALYRYYGDDMPLERVIDETQRLRHGGTLAVLLAKHAMRRGYKVQIYTYNVHVFDPTWFEPGAGDMRDLLRAQIKRKRDARIRFASRAYIEFLDMGGEIYLRDLTRDLIRKHLDRGVPILTGLNATYLYREARERQRDGKPDPIGGESTGHFVVLSGYDREERTVSVADPLESNPVSRTTSYDVDIDRLMCSILLGIATYDANLLIIRPGDSKGSPSPAPTTKVARRKGAKGGKRARARRRQ
ncbi:MAG: hypothetical protein EA379_06250 [Phycisphaerales bacterium]|nr:MAG: hypothetical protein EA379_06250 [Phycisphaerales bacterium]